MIILAEPFTGAVAQRGQNSNDYDDNDDVKVK
jgi:hypothetical protein